MTLTNHARQVALLCLFLGTACAEPVDCALEPKRCPNQAVRQTDPASDGLANARPFRGAQRLLQVPVDPNAPGQPPSRQPLAVDLRLPAKVPAEAMPLPAGAPSRDELNAMVATVQLPTKARSFEGLRPFNTSRLYDTLEPLLAKDGDRLWRHLDKYLIASDKGFKTEVESVEADRVQLHLRLPNGDDLRPIVVRQNGVWKIDRF